MAAGAVLNKRYIIYVRSVLTLSLILVGAYNYEVMAGRMEAGLAYLAVLLLSNAAVMLLPPGFFLGVKIHYFIFVMDMALILAGTQIMTVLDMPFIIAVFLAVFISALGQSVRLSLIVAVVVNAVYYYTKVQAAGEAFDEGALLNMPFVFVVALHSSYMAERAEEEEIQKRRLERMNDKLAKKAADTSKRYAGLLDFTEELSESFQDALVVFDLEGTVNVFNTAAVELFGISREKAVGRPIKDLPVFFGVKEILMELKFGGKPVLNREVTINRGQGEEKISATVSFIAGRDEKDGGILLYARKI